MIAQIIIFYLFKVHYNGLFLYTVRIQPLFYDHKAQTKTWSGHVFPLYVAWWEVNFRILHIVQAVGFTRDPKVCHCNVTENKVWY